VGYLLTLGWLGLMSPFFLYIFLMVVGNFLFQETPVLLTDIRGGRGFSFSGAGDGDRQKGSGRKTHEETDECTYLGFNVV